MDKESLSTTRTGVPQAEDVDRIAGLSNPVVRNLLITQTYFELSRAVRDENAKGANWCTFATWASKQAGNSIRSEDLRRAFESRFRDAPEVQSLIKQLVRISQRRMPADTRHAAERVLAAINPEEIFSRVSDAIARGNKKVFEEIGREFARYLATTGGSEEQFADFVWELRPGAPPEGQELLQTAFTSYRVAAVTTDAKQRAERMLFANLLVGLHEQTRLQPEIEEALNAPFRNAHAIKTRLLQLVLPAFLQRARHRISGWFGRPLPADRLTDRLVNRVQRIARRVTTEHLMTLHLAGNEVLRLGQDLRNGYPPELQAITIPELKELLQRIDPTPDSLSHSGAVDWADLDERMHFIADFFRCYHVREDLFEPPFAASQVEDMKGGRVPRGPL